MCEKGLDLCEAGSSPSRRTPSSMQRTFLAILLHVAKANMTGLICIMLQLETVDTSSSLEPCACAHVVISNADGDQDLTRCQHQ